MTEGEPSPSSTLPAKRRGDARIRPVDLMLAALCGLAALACYARTLAASIAWGDSPELTAAAFQAGVPHPTGYPLYMLLAHGFITVARWGSVAQRMNFLSALSAAGAVAVLYLLARVVARSRAVAAMTALLYAFSLTFWSQAVIAEVYAFHVLLNAAALLCVVWWDRTGSRAWLAAAALAYGLCFTHHLMSVLLAPGLLYFAFTSPRRTQLLRALPWALPLFLAPLLLYAYLPLAALRDPALNWGDPRTPGNFLLHVTGGIYRGKMFHQSPAGLWRSIVQYAGPVGERNTGLLISQWGPALLPLALIGLTGLFRLRPRLFGLTLLVYLTVVIYALNYNIPDIEAYYLPAHLITALWIGCGVRQLGIWLAGAWRRRHTAPAARRSLRRGLAAALLALPLLALSQNWQANNLSDDWSALSYAHAALDALPPRAVALAAGDREYFPLLYARNVEKRRLDVTIVGQGGLNVPQYLRLTTRLRREGLAVNVPSCYLPAGARKPDELCFVRELTADNIAARPVTMIGKEGGLDGAVQATGFFPYRDVNLSMRRIGTQAPRWDVAPDRPSHPAAVLFAGSAPALQLEGWDAEPHWSDDVLWLRMRYYWRTLNPELARRLRVWASFADAGGAFDRLDTGEPAMANIHDLGQGAQFYAPPPPRFRETFEVAVPRSQQGKPLHLWIGVANGEKFLRVEGGKGNQVDVGALPW